MIDAPGITRIDAQSIAVIPVTIPKAEIQAVMGPGIGELMATIAAQGIAAAGPWFTHHVRLDPDVWEFEIGVPVAAPVVVAGRVQPAEDLWERYAAGPDPAMWRTELIRPLRS